jgi:hypothetical protein
MSRHRHLPDENGASAEPEAAPNVYHPHADEAPPYDEYADPAAAHGWQNAYDETRELQPVRDGGGGVEGGGRAARRRQDARRSRRVVVVGALGVVSVAALVVGFAVSGTSSGGSHGKDDRTSPTAGASKASATGSPEGSATGASAAGSSASARPSDSAVSTPTTAGPTTTAPAATKAAPSATATPTRSIPGHGHGATKHPK